ncbi:MAG: hypothetical protein AAGF76_09665 [Pseudomonadota bacterium]
MAEVGSFSNVQAQYTNPSSSDKKFNLVGDDNATNLHKASTRKTNSQPGPDEAKVQNGVDSIAKSIDKELGAKGFGRAILSKLGLLDGVKIGDLKAIGKEVQAHKDSKTFGATTHTETFQNIHDKYFGDNSAPPVNGGKNTLRFSVTSDVNQPNELYEHEVGRDSRKHATFKFFGISFNIFRSSERKQMGLDFIAKSITNQLDFKGLTFEQRKEGGIMTGPELLKEMGFTNSIKVKDLPKIMSKIESQQQAINNLRAEMDAGQKISDMMAKRNQPETQNPNFLNGTLDVNDQSNVKISQDGSGGVSFIRNNNGQDSVAKIEPVMSMMKTKHVTDLVQEVHTSGIDLDIDIPEQELIQVKKNSNEYTVLNQKFDELAENSTDDGIKDKAGKYKKHLKNEIVVKTELLNGKTVSDYSTEEKVKLLKTKEIPNDLGKASIIGASLGLSDHMGLNGLGYANMENMFLTDEGRMKFIDMDTKPGYVPQHLEKQSTDPMFKDIDGAIDYKFGFSEDSMKKSIGDTLSFLEKITDPSVDVLEVLNRELDEANLGFTSEDHPLQQVISIAIKPDRLSAMFKTEETDRLDEMMSPSDKREFIARVIGGVIDGLEWMSENAEALGQAHDSMKPNIVMDDPVQTFGDLKSTIDNKLDTIKSNYENQYAQFL